MAPLQTLIANPFALMMAPDEVLKAVEGSARLSGLTRHVCRPLDRPLMGKVDDDGEPSAGAARTLADLRSGS